MVSGRVSRLAKSMVMKRFTQNQTLCHINTPPKRHSSSSKPAPSDTANLPKEGLSSMHSIHCESYHFPSTRRGYLFQFDGSDEVH